MTEVYAVTVTDPSKCTWILAEHTDLTLREARELGEIYQALGHGPDDVLVREARVVGDGSTRTWA